MDSFGGFEYFCTQLPYSGASYVPYWRGFPRHIGSDMDAGMIRRRQKRSAAKRKRGDDRKRIEQDDTAEVKL